MASLLSQLVGTCCTWYERILYDGFGCCGTKFLENCFDYVLRCMEKCLSVRTSKLGALSFKIYITDHNAILHTSRQLYCRDVCRILLSSVECILNQSTTKFGRISNSIEISLVGWAPGGGHDSIPQVNQASESGLSAEGLTEAEICYRSHLNLICINPIAVINPMDGESTTIHEFAHLKLSSITSVVTTNAWHGVCVYAH